MKYGASGNRLCAVERTTTEIFKVMTKSKSKKPKAKSINKYKARRGERGQETTKRGTEPSNRVSTE